ncbi:cation-binding protein [Erythrobacter litoralis]|uniref:hemerythrin domain-containing protein n=1 Tax=Erythrobacter litoralis TaxID=39960 RepID=UPI002435A874|nr:hemerythrin domain-containing protein [Erythrobacter litoralis]MDG6078743.1 cation-binding protein [Erythrobacter litoralis]
MDIVDAILHDHGEQRRLFAALDEAGEDKDSLGKIFNRLKNHLESHAQAEEQYFYPALLKKGEGAADSESAEETTEDAIGDHNEIAEALEEAAELEVGSDEWWEKVDLANCRNSAHLSEEERQGMPDFRRHVSSDERRKLGIKYLAFQMEHDAHYEREKKDVDEYIEENQAA